MENREIAPNFPACNNLGNCQVVGSDEVLSYLNSGGTLEKVVPVASQSGIEKIMDITGDGAQELIMRPYGAYHVIGCKDGNYGILFDFTGDFGVYLGGTPDLNRNGIPELVLYDVTHYGFVLIYIYEWADSAFRSLISEGGNDSILATSPHKIIDTNGDGLEELVITDDVHERETWFFGGLDVAMQRPLRKQTRILGWNGRNFVNIKQGTNAPAEYRFQAIQDGDEQVRYGNYRAALSIYQAAVFDDQLKWWSPAQRKYELDVYMSQFDRTPTIYPTPSPDMTEYPRLAAYAYYRIMLLHIVQGHDSDAGTVYKTLGQRFSNNSYARPHYEMATEFWNAYQSNHRMYDGCAAAIQYAAQHPQILTPLGSDYHGGYSQIYTPVDTCPFR